MNDAPHIELQPTVGTTPEQARDARARAWRFVLDCYAKKTAVELTPEPDSRNDGTKVQEDSANVILPD